MTAKAAAESLGESAAACNSATGMPVSFCRAVRRQKCPNTLTSLTLQIPRRKSNGKHNPVNRNFYAEWRLRSGVVAILREDRESPPEALLQAIWQHQRLKRDELATIDGRPVRILHPGFRSVEGGPDFRGAVVQFGDDPPHSGEIEVDLRPSGWHGHGHDRNPARSEEHTSQLQ